MAAKSFDEQSSLDSTTVSNWLDNHPEFLHDYIKKLQIQRRRTSLLSDKSGLLLANFNTNCHKKTPNTPDLLTTSDPLSILNHTINSKPSSGNLSSPISFKGLGHNSNASSLISLPLLLNNNTNLNPSLSEPNLPPKKDSEFMNSHENSKIQVSRCKFRQLGLYEKMYTLVKCLYQSLDLKTTCKKILNTVSLLLDADRCSLFLVVNDDDDDECLDKNLSYDDLEDLDSGKKSGRKCLVSVVFDAKSNSLNKLLTSYAIDNMDEDFIEEEDGEQIKIPYGKGIVGYVASTGESVNIADAYNDPRFNSTIDQKTGYKTKSILCLPILNEYGQCIAVAEAINKLSDESESEEQANGSDFAFTKEDEEIFSKFMPFISIAIRNSNLYSQSQKEAQTNKVLLELATIVFDESSTTVDHLVSRILFNSIFLLECERCQVILLNTNANSGVVSSSIFPRRPSFHDINKYFDRIYELNYNDLKTNEKFSHEILVKPKSPNFTSDSPELGIINTVIQSGEILNIPNACEDSNFANFGQTTKTNSLLCIPVTNSSDQVVALIFACNKIKSSTLNYFSKSDINIAEAFALFCGIGIQNIMMYEKVVRAMNMQQVALDVLSYHVSSNQDEVDRLVKEEIPEPVDFGLYSFFFDENTLDEMGTLKACISMFGELELIDKFNIPYDVLCRFFLTVKKNYRPVAYHNWRHGFNVMSSMFTILTSGNFKKVYNDLEILSLLIACICHDLDHRGTTNNFQIKIQSPLAKLYTTSTMEHHHFNQCIIILHNNMNNILMNLTPTQHSTAIDLIEKAIIATDLALHFKHIDKFLEKSNSPDKHVFESANEKELLSNILMTACDLSGGTKKWNCHFRLSQLVSSEFFIQGDLEKEKFKQEPIDSMNRNKSDKLPQMQIQFLNSVCVPMYHGLSLCNPLLKPMLDGCNDNIKLWERIIKDQSNANNE
ncbi:unnamed protein product [Brachionus calyciflorus]|uniref:Phosphodiesterase n=1 Tax=Brachionus calyciflorus TaxID=104777 RepID=A0A814DE80_9BILA|nr:unnamed protein product [Brachionus calyciflorus]